VLLDHGSEYSMIVGTLPVLSTPDPPLPCLLPVALNLTPRPTDTKEPQAVPAALSE